MNADVELRTYNVADVLYDPSSSCARSLCGSDHVMFLAVWPEDDTLSPSLTNVEGQVRLLWPRALIRSGWCDDETRSEPDLLLVRAGKSRRERG